MTQALVLNATYEPLCVVPSRRALMLILDEKAELLHATERLFRAERLARGGAVGRAALLLRQGSVSGPGGAQPAGRVRSRRPPMPVLRGIGGEHRPRDPPQQGRNARMGQRGGVLPSLQHPKARPAARGQRHAAPPPADGAPGADLDPGRHRRHPLRLGAIPGVEGRQLVGLRPCPAPAWHVEHRQGSARLLLDQSLQDWQSFRSVDRQRCGGPPSGAHTAHRPAGGGPRQRPARVRRRPGRGGAAPACRWSGGPAGAAPCWSTPSAVLWIDLIIPAGDPLWDTDVRRAAWWVGEAWAAAVDRVGAGPAQVWRGGMRPRAWSGRVCFAGLGPGEVSVGARKVVGISQRRTRQAALFQTAALLQWEPAALLALLAVDDDGPAGRGRGPGRGGRRRRSGTSRCLDRRTGSHRFQSRPHQLSGCLPATPEHQALSSCPGQQMASSGRWRERLCAAAGKSSPDARRNVARGPSGG